MEQTKLYILYKTTCTVTENFYVGIHSTTNLEDGYLGSGLRLSRSIQKHGKENHTREILELFETREELMKREKEVVNEELLKDPKCLNIQKGGNTGWTKEAQAKNNKKGRESRAKVFDTVAYKEKMSSSVAKSVAEGKLRTDTWKNKHLSDSHRKSIGLANSISMKGEKNSQFGKVWIYHIDKKKSFPVSKEEIEVYLAQGWIKGRKRF